MPGLSLSDENKERIIWAQGVAQAAVHYGWLPLVLYYGWTVSNPRPSFIKLVTPLA